MLHAGSHLGSPAEAPDTGSLRADLEILAGALAQQLRSPGWPAVLPSIIDAAERDTEVAQVHAAMQARFSAPFLLAAERAL